MKPDLHLQGLRIEGPDRYKTMTMETGEFIRRFLMHVLPKGFHRIPRASGSARKGNQEYWLRAGFVLVVVPDDARPSYLRQVPLKFRREHSAEHRSFRSY
jgi:Putative transposase